MKLLPIAILGGLAALAFGATSSKAATPEPTPGGGGGGGDPTPTPEDLSPGADEYLPGTTTLKSRVRMIDASTPTPSQFAQKYSGTASRWREIVAANPTGTIFPGSPAIRVVDILKAPEAGTEGPPTKVGEGLSPWNLGQLVKLPDTWVG